MSIIIDLVIIGLIVLFTFIGYKQGLIKAAIKIAAFFIAIIIAFVLYKPVSNFVINNTTIDDNIQNKIVNSILPEGATPDQEVKLSDNISNSILNATQGTVNNIARELTVKVIETGSLLIIYIIAKIALRFISVIADFIAKIPILKQFNKFGGIIYGFIRGIITIYVILAIISLASPIIENSTISAINESSIGGILYNNNILLNILF